MSAEKETIYVVGYPKSGNTWLVRLLADLLKVPVLDKVMEGAPEMATDVNRELGLEANSSSLSVAKIHYRPADFTEHVTANGTKFVYIVRDFRDQCVSSFFYFKRENQELARLYDRGDLVRLNLLRSVLMVKANWRLQSFARKLARGKVGFLCRSWGTWSEHYRQWQAYFADHAGQLDHVVVRYEDLLADTEAQMRRILRELAIEAPDDESLAESIERQSFGSLKKKYQTATGKRTKSTFFRKGKSKQFDDYLDADTLQLIDDYQGDVLRDNGYLQAGDSREPEQL